MNQYQKWILTGLFASSVSLLCADQPSAKPMTSGAKPAQSNDKKPMSQNDITPPAGPLVDAGARFVMTADFIYWQMKQDNMAYSISNGGGAVLTFPSTTTRAVTITNNEKVGKLDFDYQPGFKVGAGIISDHDNWDLFAQYTWLRQHASGHQSTGRTDTLPNSDFFGEEKDYGTWTSHFNNIDLELGRSFFISRRLVLRPHIGLKGAWINQKFNTTNNHQGVNVAVNDSISNLIATLTDSNSSVLFGITDFKTRQSQRFWGVGLRAGLNTSWHFTRDWSIYGNMAASELSCRFKDKVTIKGTIQHPPSAPEGGSNDAGSSALTATTDSKSRNAFHIMRPVLEMALGLRYEMMFSDDNYQFFMQAGWEQQIWLDHNQFLVTQGTSNAGELTMQGLDVKFGLAF